MGGFGVLAVVAEASLGSKYTNCCSEAELKRGCPHRSDMALAVVVSRVQ